METFDPKPMLTKYAGKTYAETPFPNPVDSPLHRERFRSAPAEEINIRDVYTKIFPMQVGFSRHGESGIAVTDWWPHLAKQVDDICFVRNMWTTDNDHAAENQIHTGRHKLDETQPSIGAWAHYGLGSLNEDLPRFVVWAGRHEPTPGSRSIRTTLARRSRRSVEAGPQEPVGIRDPPRGARQLASRPMNLTLWPS
ncbi:MAG: hypothetical protein Ct9H300mP1_06170 [Planctomycetaceae bacterium]|nr:MAG: hypothetical protein Ct9H300mP1_06170 [Planctomycetaceae bacterium]